MLINKNEMAILYKSYTKTELYNTTLNETN